MPLVYFVGTRPGWYQPHLPCYVLSPDYQVRVSRRLLQDDDGPMLEVLKGFHGSTIGVPQRPAWRPDRERLAERFDRFLAQSGA